MGIIAVALATALAVIQFTSKSPTPIVDNELRIPVTFKQTTRSVNLYYYDANKDKNASGVVLCSKQGLVPVTRTIPVTITPIQDTINLLLKGELTGQEKSAGVTTEYPLAGLTLKGASVYGTALTLEFTDPQNKTSGGSCRASILWAQIEATALQFPEVKSVNFIPTDLFQP